MKNINVMSTPELQDLLSLMETKEAADEALPSEVVRAILSGLWAMEKQRRRGGESTVGVTDSGAGR